MITNKGQIIFTFDDVIMNTSYNLYKYLSLRYAFYGKFLDIFKLYSKEDIDNRTIANIIEYLYNEKIKNNDFYKATFAFSILNNYYLSKYDIYDNELPTPLAKGTLLNPLFYENAGIENVYILIKYATDIEKEYKEKFVKKYLSNSVKFKFVYLKNTESYSDYIIKNIPKWDLIVTDDIEAVEQLAKLNIDHHEFFLPNYGYDKASPFLKELIKQKNASINYF